MQAPQPNQQELAEQRDRTEGYLRVDPKNKMLLTRAIELNLALSNADVALGHAKAAVALFPDDPMVVCLQAHVLTAQRKFADAGAIYARLLKSIKDADLAFSLANCQVWQGQHQAALDTMAPYQALPDLSAGAVTLIVRALHHVGKFDHAKELIEQHRERLAAEPAFLAASALVYLDTGDVEQAAVFSNAAMALGETPIEAIVVNATLSLAQGESDAAIEQFQQALAINPNEGRSWAGMGEANLLARDLDAAKSQLERATKLMPKHIGSWASLGWCHVFSKNLPAADKAFKKALEIDRNFAETHGSIATVDAMKGEREAAEQGIERALRLDPQCMSARMAQMVLGGQAADPERFYALAMRVVGGRKNAFGTEIKDMVDRQLGKLGS